MTRQPALPPLVDVPGLCRVGLSNLLRRGRFPRKLYAIWLELEQSW